MSRLNYESVIEMIQQAISDKNKSINLEVDLISECDYADEIIDRSMYLARVVAGRDALMSLLRDIHQKENGL